VIEIIAVPEYSRAGFAGHLSSESKNFGIAVIPEDNHVMLRYIWMFGGQGQHSTPSTSTTKNINDSFTLGFEKHYEAMN